MTVRLRHWLLGGLAALAASGGIAAQSAPAESIYPAPSDRLYKAMTQAEGLAAGEAATFADTGPLVLISIDITNDHGGALPWASVTKQVLATMAMQLVEEGRLSLDARVSEYIPVPRQRRVAMPTVRQLLRHQAGLRNPDETPPGERGIPSFYLGDGGDPLKWCLTGRSAPQAEGFRYNNCDYVTLGAVLEAASGKSLQALFDERIAAPAGLEATRFSQPSAPLPFELGDTTAWRQVAGYGASGGLVGPMSDMARFSRALAEGRLLSSDSLETLWAADESLGYMALGQWVFPANLAGCQGPVRIVERRGEIGDFKVRNFILPDRGRFLSMVLIGAEQDFGEIWTGSGLAHELLSKTFCEKTR